MAPSLLQLICAVPVLGGTVFSLLCLMTVARFRLRNTKQTEPEQWPAVSVLKPVHGLEKNLEENLRTACLQDYPDYQVVFSVQRRTDPALAVLERLAEEFGPARVTVVVEERRPGTNGKINNLAGALPAARHDLLVISDSDVRLPVHYLRAIVGPLMSDERAGFVCTPYKAASAGNWYERMELLSLNADFMPSVVFAYETGVSPFCLGASIALRRRTLEKIGGIEDLADYLVEDYEMGRRILARGASSLFVPPVVETMVDLKSAAQWWGHQVYWDQNTRAARPLAYFCTLLIRAVPFALLLVLLRRADALSLAVLGLTLGVRLATAGLIMGWGWGDREGVRALPLLPLRDLAGLISWLLAFTRRTTVWRGKEFLLTRDGRLVSREGEHPA